MVIFRFLSWKHYNFIGTRYAKRAISSNILFYIHCKWSPNNELLRFICRFPRVLPLSIRTMIRAETRAKSRSGRVRVRARAHYKRPLVFPAGLCFIHWTYKHYCAYYYYVWIKCCKLIHLFCFVHCSCTTYSSAPPLRHIIAETAAPLRHNRGDCCTCTTS
jgi:hypothetical protein